MLISYIRNTSHLGSLAPSRGPLRLQKERGIHSHVCACMSMPASVAWAGWRWGGVQDGRGHLAAGAKEEIHLDDRWNSAGLPPSRKQEATGRSLCALLEKVFVGLLFLWQILMSSTMTHGRETRMHVHGNCRKKQSLDKVICGRESMMINVDGTQLCRHLPDHRGHHQRGKKWTKNEVR